MKHFLKKLCSTVRILACLGLARTFGQYEHSGWDGTISFARYRWHGQSWVIPTSSAKGEATPLGMPDPRLTETSG